MGEPAAAAAATSERDVLLATKLNVPGVGPDLVPRPRLAQRLEEGRGRGLVLACAPAGYGRTVLLAGWVRRGRQPVGWLSLDAGDNDPARFWRHAVAARDRVRPGISQRMGPLFGPPPPRSFEPLVTALINEVAGRPDAGQALLLVLDDYHVISSQLVHDSVGFLLEHRPPGLVLALTSRSDPPLALARLRARGQLTELRATDLRFTPGEAAALLAQVAAAPGGARPGAPGAGSGRCGAGRADRGLGGRAAAGWPVAARARRCRRVRRSVYRQPPLRPGLPGRGGAGAAARPGA
jgi:LuxR family transcriptional regulator, maltose regulon positive regulatory protein